MSLINKMLQDLDARGSRPNLSAERLIKPVPGREPRSRLWLLLGALLAALCGAGLYWRLVDLAPAALPAPAPAIRPVLPAPRTPLPAAARNPDQPLLPLVSAAAASAPAQPSPAASPVSVSASVPRRRHRARLAPAAQAHVDEHTNVHAVNELQEAKLPQQAESAYRKALGALGDGQLRLAISGLEEALRFDPLHEAARQTLIGLLLENKRPDEAMQQLQQDLALNPRQPGLAMTLARLQVERGGPALETLLRSLPYSLERADYQAFVAALMQRAQRHKEALGYYETALRLNPQNGLWWMGLGISLQAEQRLAEARNAYQRAKATTSLSPELQHFIDLQLAQMGR